MKNIRRKAVSMEIKGIKEAVELVEKKTGIDLPEEKVEAAVKKVATKKNIEKAKDVLEDVVEKIKK